MVRPRILDEAAEELAAAADYLEREGSARDFLDAYEKKLRQLIRFPKSGPLIRNAPGNTELRSFLLRGFRHALIVGVLEGTPTIIAVAHTSREPGYWRERVK